MEEKEIEGKKRIIWEIERKLVDKYPHDVPCDYATVIILIAEFLKEYVNRHDGI